MAKRVLLIDDESSNHELAAAFLEPEGYEVFSADRGESGLLLAAREAPDLILVDLVMPDVDGYEVCRGLRQKAATRDTPIIMLTGSEDSALNRKACAAVAQACILKPFRREALIAVVQAVQAAIPQETA
jgi:CheY-like chemotaxis protein